jgi:hypothetical protein
VHKLTSKRLQGNAKLTDLIQIINAIKADDPTLLPRVSLSSNKLEFPDLLLPSSPSPQPSRPRLSEQTNGSRETPISNLSIGIWYERASERGRERAHSQLNTGYRGEAELGEVGAWRDKDVAAHPVRAGHVAHLHQLLVLVVFLFLLVVVVLLLLIPLLVEFLLIIIILLPRVAEAGEERGARPRRR